MPGATKDTQNTLDCTVPCCLVVALPLEFHAQKGFTRARIICAGRTAVVASVPVFIILAESLTLGK